MKECEEMEIELHVFLTLVLKKSKSLLHIPAVLLQWKFPTAHRYRKLG
jgi:hypothetical protein